MFEQYAKIYTYQIGYPFCNLLLNTEVSLLFLKQLSFDFHDDWNTCDRSLVDDTNYIYYSKFSTTFAQLSVLLRKSGL